MIKALYSTLALSTLLFGAGSVNSSVTINPDGTGDFLVAPAYFANKDGWSSLIRIINRDTAHSVVAKLALLDGANSYDTLHVTLYLTPGDVFEATLVYEEESVYLQSSDDSLIINNTLASQSPITLEVAKDLKNSSEYFNEKFGYIELFGIAQSGATINNTNLSQAPVDKLKFKEAYEKNFSASHFSSVGNDALAMEVSIINAQAKAIMHYSATAFENFSGGKVSNSAILDKEVHLSDYSNINSTNLLAQLESATTYKSIDFNYYTNSSTTNESVLILTAITKRARFENGSLENYYEAKEGANKATDYFMRYVYQSRDMQEHFITPPEPEPLPLDPNPSVPYCDANSTLTGVSGSNPCTPIPVAPPTNAIECYTEMCYIPINGIINYKEGLFSLYTLAKEKNVATLPLLLNVQSVDNTNITYATTPVLTH